MNLIEKYAEESARPAPGVVVRWDFGASSAGQYSLIDLMEQRHREIREEYLAWVYELGESRVGKRSLLRYLSSRFGDVSFWASSLINQKSPTKTVELGDVFRLRVLEMLYEELGAEGLRYYGSNRDVHRILRAWCREMGHSYEYHPASRAAGRSLSWHRRLPHPVQALVFLSRDLVTRYLPAWRNSLPRPEDQRKVRPTVVTYFPNYCADKAEQGQFRSHYWEGLHRLFDRLDTGVDWVWLHANSPQCTFRETLAWRKKFEAGSRHRFYVLEELVGPGALLRALGSWLMLQLKALRLGRIRKHFRFPGSRICFFPLLRHDWRSSLVGKAALENAIWTEAFEAMACRLPAVPWGIYLWEGMGWELALIAAWRRHGVPRILGHQHSTLRPLDTRALRDPRGYEPSRVSLDPIPDCLVVNGAGALRLLEETGYPADRVTVAEAARYVGLAGRRGECTRPLPIAGRKLLVVLGSLAHESELQLELLNEAARAGALASYDSVWIKSHPDLDLQPVLARVRPVFRFQLRNVPLGRLWNDVDVVYCASSTAALMEAMWLGLPAFASDVRQGLNLNPLYGMADDRFAKTPNEVAAKLAAPPAGLLPADYFELDQNLSNWRRMLETGVP